MNMGSKVSSDGTSAPTAVCVGGRGREGRGERRGGHGSGEEGRGGEVKEVMVTMAVTDIMMGVQLW